MINPLTGGLSLKCTSPKLGVPNAGRKPRTPQGDAVGFEFPLAVGRSTGRGADGGIAVLASPTALPWAFSPSPSVDLCSQFLVPRPRGICSVCSCRLFMAKDEFRSSYVAIMTQTVPCNFDFLFLSERREKPLPSSVADPWLKGPEALCLTFLFITGCSGILYRPAPLLLRGHEPWDEKVL